jgi:import receptor subunit TOM20
MEQFFLTQISQAEGLLAQGILYPGLTDSGPTMYITAAQHFYKALKVYPNTVELLEIYNKTVPEVPPLGNNANEGGIPINFGNQRGG